MSIDATLERPRRTIRARPADEAALRRLAALMRAEAAELGGECWLARHLDGGPEAVPGWGARVLPELNALMGPAQDAADPWAPPRPGRSPLGPGEEAALRRLAVWMRAEAAELGGGSALARRLDAWGVRLALACADPARGLPALA